MTRGRRPVARAQVEQAISRLLRLYASRRVHADLTAAAGVDVTRAGLAVLRRLDGEPPLALGEVARRTNMDPAALTRQMRALEAAGLVESAPDPHDGRSRRVSVSSRGLDVVARVATVGDRHLTAALSGWSVQDQAMLADLLRRLVSDLQAEQFPELDAAPTA